MVKKKNSKARDAKKLRSAKKRIARAKATLRSTFSNKKKDNGMFLSFCTVHGPYTSDNLCACYDATGKMDGKTYSEGVAASVAKGEVLSDEGFCPLHGGPFAVSDQDVIQCGCFDKDGNRIKTPTGDMIH